jgi:outer membrane receptor protein involved in Fe transport
MPSAGIQYHVDPAVMLYLSYSRGFKAGGFNGQPSGPLANLSFGPEYVNAYELGIKSEWLDGRAMVNLDFFRSDYKDLQQEVNTQIPGTSIFSTFVANAAGEVSEGAELDIRWAPVRQLHLSANVTYLEAYYSNYHDAPQTTLQAFCSTANAAGTIPECNASFPNPVAPFFDLTGKAPPFAPRWSGSVTADYVAVFGDGYQLTVDLAPYASSRYYSYSLYPDSGVPGLGNPGYLRLDGRLSLEKEGGSWAVDIIGKNLTDHTILVFNTPGFSSKEQPRNVAIQLRYKLR